jgi:hypothetical protein
MTRTFERFLRAFDDDELARFARERAVVRPPYWRALQLALQVEADRRGLRVLLDDGSPAAGELAGEVGARREPA